MKREQSLVLLEEIKNVNKDFDLGIQGTMISHAFYTRKVIICKTVN